MSSISCVVGEVYRYYMLLLSWRFKSLALTLCLAAAQPTAAQEGGDIQAQIVYAFHAEDMNQLENLAQMLSTQRAGGATGATLRYHLAHAEYRLGLLSQARDGRAAGAAFARCIDELKPVPVRDARSAEAAILQSACYSNLADHEKFQATLWRARAADRLKVAAALAPRNPRLVYIRAMDMLAHAGHDSVQLGQGLAQLELAAQLFEQSWGTSVEVPGWGHADAYLDLGRVLGRHGDVVGARNWIEKALIAAPDFDAARRELALLVHH